MNKDKALNYEVNFNGGLISTYKKDMVEYKAEFLNDLTKEVKLNGVGEILDYYTTYVISMNDTNSTNEKRLAIKELILLLR